MKRLIQKEMASILDISPNFLSEVFNGHRRFSWKNAKRISKLLDIEPLMIFDQPPDSVRRNIIKAILNQRIKNMD